MCAPTGNGNRVSVIVDDSEALANVLLVLGRSCAVHLASISVAACAQIRPSQSCMRCLLLCQSAAGNALQPRRFSVVYGENSDVCWSVDVKGGTATKQFSVVPSAAAL